MDINHIAKLARIGLNEEELQRLEKEFAAILTFVEKLKEVDIANIKPMSGGTDLINVMREDEVSLIESEIREKILKNAPKKEDNYIEVMAVFD